MTSGAEYREFAKSLEEGGYYYLTFYLENRFSKLNDRLYKFARVNEMHSRWNEVALYAFSYLEHRDYYFRNLRFKLSTIPSLKYKEIVETNYRSDDKKIKYEQWLEYLEQYTTNDFDKVYYYYDEKYPDVVYPIAVVKYKDDYFERKEVTRYKRSLMLMLPEQQERKPTRRL
jgi:hypothetical protein